MPKIQPLAAFLVLVGVLSLAAGSKAFAAEVAAAAPVPAAGPIGPDLPTASPDEASEMSRLKSLPANHIPLKGATLASAIRLLSESAHMSYIAPPDAEFAERVTSDVMMNPYDLLQMLADNYHFGMEYRSGVWWFYTINLNELVTKAYTLRYNNLQQVSITSQSINSQLAAFNSSGGGMGMAGGMGAMGSPGGGAGAAPRPSGSNGTFNSKTDKIIEDIKKIIGLPTVGMATPSLEGSSEIPGMAADRKPVEAPKIEPIWNPDTSQLFVVATRQQHSLIAAYLKTVDQPQKLIRISVKFVETARNPSQALGVDWSQTFLGSGGPITLSGGALSTTASAVSNAGTATITTSNQSASSSTNTSGTTSGSTTSASTTGALNPLSQAINLAHPGSIALPISLLSAPAFQFTAQAIAQDQFSSVVQDPVIYTSNNREVTFKATSQQPIQEGTTTIGSGTAATTSSIAYIDVGTEVTILPCILPGRGTNRELVQLNLSINVSSITGQQIIGGNPYPITSSRTYSYTVSIPNGETLAIAGLEERSRQTTDSKVPIFGDIPLIGYAFKNKTDSVVHTTLLAFITPELITTDGSEEVAKSSPLPMLRHRPFLGSASETKAEIQLSLEGLPTDIAALQNCVNRTNKDAVLNRLDQIGVELALMDVRLGELKLTGDKLTALQSRRVDKDRDLLATARSQVAKFSIQAN